VVDGINNAQIKEKSVTDRLLAKLEKRTTDHLKNSRQYTTKEILNWKRDFLTAAKQGSAGNINELKSSVTDMIGELQLSLANNKHGSTHAEQEIVEELLKDIAGLNEKIKKLANKRGTPAAKRVCVSVEPALADSTQHSM
jgi:hypothetical protein